MAHFGPPDPTGFAPFFQAHYPAVVRLLFSLVGSTAVAEDLAQESFAVAHDRWARVQCLDRPDLWVRRVAINRAIGTVRRGRSERRALERLRAEVPPASANPFSCGPDEPLWRAVRSLPRRQQEMVALVYVDDLSIDDAANTLGMSASTARTHLQRARQRLAATIDTQKNPEKP